MIGIALDFAPQSRDLHIDGAVAGPSRLQWLAATDRGS
jgi:hypothetical protein